MLDFMMNLFLVFTLVSLFNLVRYTLKVRKVMRQHKDNPNVRGITIANGEIKVIEKNTEETIEKSAQTELVIDPSCGKEIEKKDAYCIFKNGKQYFFCCWECREQFLDSFKQPQTLA